MFSLFYSKNVFCPPEGFLKIGCQADFANKHRIKLINYYIPYQGILSKKNPQPKVLGSCITTAPDVMVSTTQNYHIFYVAPIVKPIQGTILKLLIENILWRMWGKEGRSIEKSIYQEEGLQCHVIIIIQNFESATKNLFILFWISFFAFY